IRVSTERVTTAQEKDELNDSEPEGVDEETASERKRQREVAYLKSLSSWRKFAAGKGTDVVDQPAIYETVDDSKFPLEDEDASLLRRQSTELRALTAGSIIIARNFDGLWKQVAGNKPERVGTTGAYANPVVTPDGKWVVLAKSEHTWGSGSPNYVVRFNVE